VNYSCPSIFLPEGVDTSFFVPFRRDRAISTWRKCNWRCAGEKSPIPSVTKRGGTRHSLIVGWAGRLDNVKRPHLLDQLDFKVNIQSQHGAQYFVERSLDHMLRFYNSIDVLVLTSLSECMPRVVLEACACSIPVVCTDVGSIRMILDSKWIVPVNPESVVIEEMNKRLHLLGDKDLRDRVGDANRKRVEKTLSWKNLMPFWDTAFLAAIQKDTSSIQQINQHFGINQL
jgi:glycosyltransferase involved in cell wall biosynthesis